MLEELFGRSQYYNFPSFEVAVYSLLLAFVLSTVIGLTYRLTFEGDRFPKHFFQAIVLSSTVTSMVIMAVGDNLAAGFGIIGAVAIIRFRTLVRDPRNIIFIFASLSVGIATGVYGYAIALAGTLIFCTVAVLLYYSPYGKSKRKDFDLVFTEIENGGKESVEGFLTSRDVSWKIARFRTTAENRPRYSFRLIISSETDREMFFQEISKIRGLTDIRFSASEEVEL